MSKLAGALGGGAGTVTPSPAPSRFLAALRKACPLSKPFIVPIVGIEARFVLVGSGHREDIEVETVHHFAERKLDRSHDTLDAWELHRTARLLAAAVIEVSPELGPDAPPIAAWDEWRRLAPEVLVSLGVAYNDFSEEHDPALATLSELEVAMIVDALSKKNGPALRAYGARRLCTWLLTSASLPVGSPMPTSSPGESSPAS